MHPCEEKQDGCKEFLTLPRAMSVGFCFWGLKKLEKQRLSGQLKASILIYLEPAVTMFVGIYGCLFFDDIIVIVLVLFLMLLLVISIFSLLLFNFNHVILPVSFVLFCFVRLFLFLLCCFNDKYELFL